MFSSPLLTPVQINVCFAVIIGCAAALGAYVFKWLIDLFTHLCLGGADPGARGRISFLGEFDILVFPALGGLIVGPIIYRWAREAKGHGVPEVMKAVLARGGRIRPIVAVVKSIASALTIGTGGSAGSEGPIVQIGASFGSSLGQWFRMPPRRIINFLACGTAGGIAAIFNAPLAGVMFSMEVILGEFEKFSFIYVVLAAVTSSALSQYLTGNKAIFLIRYYQLASPLELFAIALLGVITAIGARLFSAALNGSEDYFERRVRVPEYLKPALGGLGVGVVALLIAVSFGGAGKRILGVGYDTIDLALQGELSVNLLLLFLAAKCVATCLTLGSGGSGGVFAPALFMGAMLGGAFGSMLHGLFPGATAPPGLYAVVGMGAFFAGMAHAPVTAILILFEMTGYRYTILLPIMTCSVISTLVASLIGRDSIYTIKLRRQGILPDQRKADPLKAMIAGEIMIRDPQYVIEDMSIATLSELVGNTLHTSLPVLDRRGELVGLLTYREIHYAMRTIHSRPGLLVKDCMNRSPLVAFTDEPCDAVFNRMKDADQGIAPVAKKKNPRRMVGILTYRHIYEAYRRALMS
jgi:CIC family chloride channel protein